MAMAALTLFIVRKSLAPAEHALIWGLALSASVLQYALIALGIQAHGRPDGGLPSNFLGVAAAALYAEGFRQRRGGTVSAVPILLVGAVAAGALVVLTTVVPVASLRSGVVPCARALLLLWTIPMVLPQDRASRYSEWTVVGMLVTIAVSDLSLVVLAGAEFAGLVASHALYLTVAALMIVPLAAAAGLFTLLLIASDFAAQRRRMVETDPLTGVLNRLGFELAARAARRRGHPLSVVVADIDHFKAINDSWGHRAGDMALARFADHLARSLHGHEAVGRIGGEEFAMLLAEPGAGARDRIERLREALSSLRTEGFPDLLLGASFGIAQRERGETMTSVIARADAALYGAKHGGRNRTIVADPRGSGR